MANARCIHHPNGPIALRAAFLGIERVLSRTAQRAIRLGDKVVPFQTASLPGARQGGWPIRRGCGRGKTCCGFKSDGGWSKLRRAHGSGMESMSQAEAQIPNPLREDLPKLLPASGVRTPPIRLLFLVLISQHGLEGTRLRCPVAVITRLGQSKRVRWVPVSG